MLIASHELGQNRVASATSVLQDYHEYNVCYPTLSLGLIRKHSTETLQIIFNWLCQHSETEKNVALSIAL